MKFPKWAHQQRNLRIATRLFQHHFALVFRFPYIRWLHMAKRMMHIRRWLVVAVAASRNNILAWIINGLFKLVLDECGKFGGGQQIKAIAFRTPLQLTAR